VADRTRLLLTGAAGFLGSHVLEHVLVNTDWDVTAVDLEDKRGRTGQVLAGHPRERDRVTTVVHDLNTPPPAPADALADYVIAMASDVDVARSLAEPESFIRNNVNVVLSTLGYCYRAAPRVVILVSTAEVYGPAIESGFGHREWAPVIPPSPYAASKAAQEAVATAYWRSYGVPVVIVNTMNLFGERQDPAKFLPTLVRKITRGEEVAVYPGRRNWLHAEDLASALLHLLSGPGPALFPLADRPDRYNVAGFTLSTENFARVTAELLGRELKYHLVEGPVRPGYDARYALDPGKLAGAGWQPCIAVGEGISRTVSWLLAHPEWLEV
jgi:dTDP-glucose 4,6-dehydratase